MTKKQILSNVAARIIYDAVCALHTVGGSKFRSILDDNGEGTCLIVKQETDGCIYVLELCDFDTVNQECHATLADFHGAYDL